MIARAALAAGIALLAASAAAARPAYTAFAGKDAVVQGKGDGKKQVFRGIDWWFSGEPALKYVRIGTIVDQRQDDGRADTVTGSRDIASLITTNGGNAVIVLNQESSKVSANPVFNTFGGQQYGQSATQGPTIVQIVTTLAVIKYVGS